MYQYKVKKQNIKGNVNFMRNSRKQNFIEITKGEFQQYSEQPITDEDATEIQKNLFGAMELLLKWDKKERISCEPCSSQASTLPIHNKQSCKISYITQIKGDKENV